MNINERLHGFLVVDKIHINELSADLYVLKYEKNGARLTYIDREDENKTFSIAFRTPPEDSTGVFHILEHSVLCGSEKFPLKDPFVELLKGSLNTFLNAMTFQDKTMYPVSSRNDKDFINLVDVYMDAVLHPLAVKSPNAFYQEGWHYELREEDDSLSYKGVVLNEMRGEYSSPDTIADRHINEMLYPDTCYREDSGGDPEYITALTYDEFVRVHKKYYHPSNAEIFLDGSVKLDEILPLLDSYLSHYERAEIKTDGICYQKKIPASKRRTEYEIPADESTENKTRVCLGYIVYPFYEQRMLFATGILFSTLFANNESPAKKAIIDSGLCEDVTVSLHDGILEPTVTVELINVKDEYREEAEGRFLDIISSVAAKGIDKEQIAASINAMEFKLRERDYGSLPLGVVNAMVSLESLLYSDDPCQNLRYEDSLVSLRTTEDGFYENTLLDIFVRNERRASLVMTPSPTLGKIREEKEAKKLENIARGMSNAEKNKIKKACRALLSWQESEDSEEALATIPRLSVSDISSDVQDVPCEICEISGRTALVNDIHTSGIDYLELFFDISDISKENLPYLFIFNLLLANMKTKHHSAIEVQSMIKAHLGSFDARCMSLTKNGEGKIYLAVSVSALDAKREAIPKILSEILCDTVFSDDAAIKSFIRQTVISGEESFVASGHQVALGRVSAATSVEAAVREYYSGYEAHKVIKALDEKIDESLADIKARLLDIQKRFITRSRVLLNICGTSDKGFLESVINSLPKGDDVAPVCHISTLPIRREGILIPAQVAFSAIGYNLSLIGEEACGSFDVIRSLAGYEYLWGAVRVRGGAYGVGMVAGVSGNVGFYSYRDPTPKRTLSCFAEVPEFLSEFASEGCDVSKYIIGAIGDTEPIRTPRMRSSLVAVRYLRGIDYDRRKRNRMSILNTDSNEILRISEILKKCITGSAVCVVAGKEKLDTLAGELDEILTI